MSVFDGGGEAVLARRPMREVCFSAIVDGEERAVRVGVRADTPEHAVALVARALSRLAHREALSEVCW